MLDHVTIFSKSGLVLWSRTMAKLKGSPVDELIQSVLLEEKGGSNMFTTEWYTLRWSLANELGVVVVALYQKSLQLHYVEDLVERVKKDITHRYGSLLQGPAAAPVEYGVVFDKLLKEAESGVQGRKVSMSNKVRFDSKDEGQHQNQTKGTVVAKGDIAVDLAAAATIGSGRWDQTKPKHSTKGTEGESGGEDSLNDRELAEARAKLKARATGRRGGRGVSRGGGGQGNEEEAAAAAAGEGVKKKGKKATVWDDQLSKGTKLSDKQKALLDRSKKSEEVDHESALMEEMRSTYLPGDGEGAEWEESDSDIDDKDLFDLDGVEEVGGGGEGGAAAASWGAVFKKTSLGSLLHGLTGNKVLGEDDLTPVMTRMRTQLMTRNVAAEVADEITASVQANLTNQKQKSFTRVSTLVQSALKEAISRVLTPKKSTDVLREVMTSKNKGQVYSMVFVGINGVGKSTSLAKVAYYLKQNGIKVLIAACDTFRSGAVEQLLVHSRCLDVPLFEKGYAKDSSSVAKAALKHAKEEGYDCVLIDTAGRMQANFYNNEPLMRALSKLISDNEPDLSLFVGEALVGNDGINQLQMFNEALANNSPSGRLHQINGVVLTKFDTIDTKVGNLVLAYIASMDSISFIALFDAQENGPCCFVVPYSYWLNEAVVVQLMLE
ncbi:unnamed protein product [Choristocarpus tenellus]